MTENSPTDPSVPAAPVEVEGGRPEVAWLDGRAIAMFNALPKGTLIDAEGDGEEGRTTGLGDYQCDWPVIIVAWPDGTTPTPTAAPTTPDIAGERDGWERVPGAWWSTSSGHAYMKRVDRDRNDSDDVPLYRPAALATPSTPGAGQGEAEIRRDEWWSVELPGHWDQSWAGGRRPTLESGLEDLVQWNPDGDSAHRLVHVKRTTVRTPVTPTDQAKAEEPS